MRSSIPGLRTAAGSLWPISLLYAVLSAAAVATSRTGQYVADNRFDQYWNPGRRLSRSLTSWDGLRGVGEVREDFWPVVVPTAILRAAGFEPWMAQRIWHAAILFALGMGTVVLMRIFARPLGLAHVVAGLVAMFGAYTAAFFVPTNLSFHLALAPWLAVAVALGLTNAHLWRWPAVFALLFFSAGNMDLPGLGYALMPSICVVFYLLVLETSVPARSIASWGWKVALLTLGISAAAVSKTLLGAGALAGRLESTEAVQISSLASSWAESIRGLGSWRSYFPLRTELLQPQLASYFTNWVVILATFVAFVLALLAVAFSRWRPRLLFALMAALSLVVMVGAYPLREPSPVGSGILGLLVDVETLSAFRNIYKAGAGFVVGTAILAGWSVAALWRRRRWGRYVAGLAVVGLAVAAFPFWTGGLYDSTKVTSEVPEYWLEAFDWLNMQDSDGRVFVLPGAARAPYTWGWPGGDLFDSMLDRSAVVSLGVPLSAPLPANLIDALSQEASDPEYRAGTLAPALRRLGIRYVLVRNDLDWRSFGYPSPEGFEPLRNDDDFVKVAEFGFRGQGALAGLPSTQLAPVEILEVVDGNGPVRGTPPASPLLVSGDGWAWAPLTDTGYLQDGRPLAYTGSLDGDNLATLSRQGSPVVITDTNRRRVRQVIGFEPDYSYLLSENQNLDRRAYSLFPVAGSQSVSWFPDATSISVDGNPLSSLGTISWFRPSNAFDGNADTAWVARRSDGPLGRTLRVELRSPTVVSRAQLSAWSGGGANSIKRVELRFSDGSAVPVDLSDGSANIRFAPRETDAIEIVVTRVDPGSLAVGLSEVSFTGLDLREFVQAPDDIFLRAEEDLGLQRSLASSPVDYVFARELGDPLDLPAALSPSVQFQETELAMMRRFRTDQDRTFVLSGEARVEVDEAGGDSGASADDGDCRDIGLRVDGRPVLVRLGVEPGRLTDFAGCGPLQLDAGWHLLESSPESPITRLELRREVPAPAVVGAGPEVVADHVSQIDAEAQVRSPEGGAVIMGQGWDPRWSASFNGIKVDGLPFDTQVAWPVPPESSGTLSASFGPQRWFSGALLVTFAFLILCLGIVLTGAPQPVPSPLGQNPAPPLSSRVTRPEALGLAMMALGISVLVGGRNGVFFGGVLFLAIVILRRLPGPTLLTMAAVAVVGAAIATVLEAPLDAPLNLFYPAARPLASELAKAAGVLFIAGLTGMWWSSRVDRGPKATVTPKRPPMRLWPKAWRQIRYYLGPVLVGVTLSIMAGPVGESPVVRDAGRSLRTGISNVGADVMMPLRDVAPFASVVSGFLPVGVTVQRALLVALAVGLTLRMGEMAGGSRLGRRAAWCAALMPALWGQSVPVLITAALLTGAALMIGSGTRRSVGRQSALALLLVGSILASYPAIAVVLALIWWDHRKDRPGGHQTRGLVALTLLFMAPLVLWRIRLGGWESPLSMTTNSDWWLSGWPAAVVSAFLLGVGAFVVARQRTVLYRWAPLAIVPAIAVAVSLVFQQGANLIGWSAPFLAVLLGMAVSTQRLSVTPDGSAPTHQSKDRAGLERAGQPVTPAPDEWPTGRP